MLNFELKYIFISIFLHCLCFLVWFFKYVFYRNFSIFLVLIYKRAIRSNTQTPQLHGHSTGRDNATDNRGLTVTRSLLSCDVLGRNFHPDSYARAYFHRFRVKMPVTLRLYCARLTRLGQKTSGQSVDNQGPVIRGYWPLKTSATGSVYLVRVPIGIHRPFSEKYFPKARKWPSSYDLFQPKSHDVFDWSSTPLV